MRILILKRKYLLIPLSLFLILLSLWLFSITLCSNITLTTTEDVQVTNAGQTIYQETIDNIYQSQEKIAYLTFDDGPTKKCTPKILDILKANDVTAAFFVTKSYIESCPDLVNRMVEEGHIVGNHSSTHPEMAGLSSDEILAELNGCADAFQKVTGVEMPRYFRPPSGVYSIHSLAQTQAAGYKTIFWSFAYQDWDTENQPGVQAAYDMVMNHYHNGCIMLLHAVSQSNTEALDQMLKSLKAQGYVFMSLDQLPAASTI